MCRFTLIRNNNGQSPFNPRGGARRSGSEDTSSASTGTTSRSTSTASSRRSSVESANETKNGGLKKEAAKLLAQGVTNGLVGAFTRGSAKLAKDLAGEVKFGKDGNKLLDNTRTGRRLDKLEDRGEAKMNVGSAQLKAGLSAVFGKKVTAKQLQRMAEAKADEAQAKHRSAILEKTLQDEKAQKRAEHSAGPTAVRHGRGARRLQKYEDYGS